MTVARMALAAFVSGATAGTLLPLFFFLAGLLAGPPPPSWWDVPMLLDWLGLGFVAGLVAATVPALLAGASMRALEECFEAARHPAAWAAAGAGVGAAAWWLFGQGLGDMERGGIDALEAGLLGASLLAGAGAALAFLAVVRLGARTPGRRPGRVR